MWNATGHLGQCGAYIGPTNVALLLLGWPFILALKRTIARDLYSNIINVYRNLFRFIHHSSQYLQMYRRILEYHSFPSNISLMHYHLQYITSHCLVDVHTVLFLINTGIHVMWCTCNTGIHVMWCTCNTCTTLLHTILFNILFLSKMLIMVKCTLTFRKDAHAEVTTYMAHNTKYPPTCTG